jgi:capsular exopolysaccharide synthesis family protein
MASQMNDISRWRNNRYLPGPEPVAPEYSRFEDADEFDVRPYLNVFIKQRRLLISVFLTVFVVGAYFTLTATSIYQASSMLQIEPQNPSVTGVGDILGLAGSSDKYDYYQTQFKLIQSNALAAKVITALKLDSNPTFKNIRVKTANPVDRVKSWLLPKLTALYSLIPLPRSQPAGEVGAENPGNNPDESGNGGVLAPKVKQSLIDQYKMLLEVKPVMGTRLVEIAFNTPSGRLSQQLADAHARNFIQLSVENRFALTKEARDFLDAKNAELKKKLEQSEDALNRYRQAHGVVSLEKGENVVVDRLVDLNRQLTTARGQRIDAESLYKVVENKSTQYLSQVVTQGMVPTLRAKLLALEADKVKYSSTFKPDHPRMIELNQQITEMNAALKSEIANVVRGIQENYFAARSKEQSLAAEAENQQRTALNLKEVGVQYAVLEEEVKVNRTLYESVLKRLNETNISNDLTISNMQITQTSVLPTQPIAPNSPLNLMISAALGFFLAVGLVFIRECLDSSVNTPQYVWRAVALNTFGVIPDLNSIHGGLLGKDKGSSLKFLTRNRTKSLPPARQQQSTASKELIVAHHPLSVITDAYRSVRTALLFSQPEKPPQVILLTSPAPGEGKTVTTLNLAIALAQDGRNVLVIDGDLRRGTCHARLGITNHRGLSNVLAGNLTLEEVLHPTSISGLSLLSRGICPPNPTDLLGSQKMREVLTELRRSFDFILVDSPPAIAVSDAAVLSVISDGVLLVFHGQKTTRAAARQAMDRLDAVRAPFLGVVLNGVNLDNPEYAYYRYYYGSDSAVMGDSEIKVATPAPATAQKEADRRDAKWEDLETKWENLGPGTVPQAFFDRIIAELYQAAGPMAPLILRDQIAAMGESKAAFPKNRLNELFALVSQEILDERLRNKFYQKMRDNFTAA